MAKLDADNKLGLFVQINSSQLSKAISKKNKELLQKTDEAIKRMPNSVIKEIGDLIIAEMKARIARGQSPLARQTRFEKYKNPKKYPGSKKPKQPVNLKLTGQFLNSLRAQALPGGALLERIVNIGYDNALARLKEEGHRRGHNGQPKRPTIAEGDEKLQPRILNAAKKEYIKIVQNYLKRRGLS